MAHLQKWCVQMLLTICGILPVLYKVDVVYMNQQQPGLGLLLIHVLSLIYILLRKYDCTLGVLYK